ncbi:chitinase A [Perilla frutescens var. hirtella]|uniref:chitinase n=1 Tax=Perilla frutescens var. hirtella TaxID=608512 RepID=A0AAD4P2H9_PERFH|nr:chitinase A [Perilla frutescens var. hirtella]
MATYSHTTLPLLLLLLLLLFLITLTLFRSSEAAGIAVYWGQNSAEGILADACNTGNYQYVNIAYLSHFGNGESPVLNLAGHCNAAVGGCTSISNDIKTCQARGIKVLLSIGGDSAGYILSNDDDVRDVAGYLWNNFLGGSSDSRPLGDAVLDGIDFDIQIGSDDPWDQLARALLSFNSEKKVYLSASPDCFIPDAGLDAAIQTGLFDFIWVKFYNSPDCEYDGNAGNVLARWNKWASQPGGQIFMGLPAEPEAAATGRIYAP